MFQDMNKLFLESMAPFREIVEIQQSMLQKLTQQNVECTQQCIEAAIHQAKHLQEISSPQQFIEMQKDYTQRLEKTLSRASEQNINTMRSAHEAIEKLTSNTLGIK